MMKIAYIEDDTQASLYMCKILNRYNIKVHPFFNASLFNETLPEGLDLILTDGDLGRNESAVDVLTTKRLHYPDIPLWLYSGSKDMLHIFDYSGFKTYEKPRELNKLLHDLKVYNAQVDERR